MKELELIHPFNKERKTLPVVLITRKIVSIQWGLSGVYDLNLKENRLTARNVASRRKGPCHWMAVDIVAVRAAVIVYCDKEDIQSVVRRQSEVHNASMPGNPGIAVSPYKPYPYAKRNH